MKKKYLSSKHRGRILILLGAFAACPTLSAQQKFQDVHPQGQAVQAKGSKGGGPHGLAAEQDLKDTAEYHFTLAQAYASDGDPDRSIEEYRLTLIFDPNSPLVYTRLATEYLKKGMLSAAMDACKEALQHDSNYTDAHLILAGLYSSSHENQAALTEYDRILKSNPKNEEAVVYKSQVLIEDGHILEAVKILQQFIKKNTDSALALYYLGRAEQQADHFKESVVAYRKAIEARAGFSQAYLALGYLYEERGMNTQAIKIYQDLYDDSQDISAANRLATIYLKEEKYKEAIPYLQSIGSSDPDDLNVQVKLGLVEMELKQYSEAISTFKKIIEKTPDSDRIHYYLGNLYEEINQASSAIGELKLIKAESKLYGDAVLHTAFLLRQSNKIKNAITFMKEAISKSPKISNFYLFEANLEDETRDTSEAISTLEKGVKIFPDDEKVRYYLGSLYDRQGKVEKSLEQMEAVLKVNPENVDALNYIGYTWTQEGIRLNDAEKLLRRALGLRPENGYIQDSWGWYLYTRGRVKEAVVQLEKAAKLKPNESIILEHLGDAYLRSNLREKALYEYSDAARFADDESSKRKIQIKADTLRRELGGEKPLESDSQQRFPASVK